MTYRIDLIRRVFQRGFVQIDAHSPEEARATVERLLQLPGYGPLAPTWTCVEPPDDKDLRRPGVTAVKAEEVEAA